MLAVMPGIAARGAAWPPWAVPDRGIASRLLVRANEFTPPTRPAPGAVPGCEAQLEQADNRDGVPRLAIVGASFTAGIGPGRSHLAWSVLLARQLHWDAVIYGDPGAGYIKRGIGHKGPVAAELERIGLPALKPSLVIIQAGHDDIGLSLPLERQRVRQAIALIHTEAPQARIALITVFPGPRLPGETRQTDQAIVSAAQAADPAVVIMDPLTEKWHFQREGDGLHPTAAGDAWIEAKVFGLLQMNGVTSSRVTGGGDVCDTAIVPPPHPARPAPPHPPHRR
jgi:lysophospholipase L1-like esterase